MRRTLVSLTVFLLLVAGSAWASDSWYRIETDRFSIIYEMQDAASAYHVASFADTVYETLAPLLDNRPAKKIPVVIAGRTSYANGFYAPLPSRIILFVTSPSERFLGTRSSDWLKSLFTHELSHYLHLTAKVGPAGFLAPLFGPELAPMLTALEPLWWIEGLTTNTETLYAEGGRGESSLFTLNYRAPIYEGRMWSLGQGAYASAYPPSNRVYATGYLMVDYLVRHWGIEAFSTINEHFLWWPFFGMDPAFRKVTGYSAHQLFTFAVEEQKSRFPTTPSVSTTAFSPQERASSHFLPFATERGVYGIAENLDDGFSLVRYDGSGSVERISRLPLSGERDAVLDETGKTVVFSFLWTDTTVENALPNAPQSYADLTFYDLDDDDFEPITHKQYLYQPDYRQGILVAIQRTAGRYRLVAVDPVAGSVSVLYDNPASSVYEPRISPDGTFVVHSETIDGLSSIRSFSLDTGRSRVVLEPASVDIRNLRFLDDRTVLYSADYRGRSELYRLDIATGHVVRLLADPVGITGAMSLDGDLVYETYTADGYYLYRLPLSDALSIAYTPPIPSLPSSVPLQPFTGEAKPYRDGLRFNFWLPVSYVSGSNTIAAALVSAGSLLGKRTLSVQGGVGLFRHDAGRHRCLCRCGRSLYHDPGGPYQCPP